MVCQLVSDIMDDIPDVGDPNSPWSSGFPAVRRRKILLQNYPKKYKIILFGLILTEKYKFVNFCRKLGGKVQYCQILSDKKFQKYNFILLGFNLYWLFGLK